MLLADLEAALTALGVTLPAAGLDLVADMAARRVRRDTLKEKVVGIDFPADTAQVAHGIASPSRILKVLKTSQHLDCEISCDDTNIRIVLPIVRGDNYVPTTHNPLTIEHTVKLRIEEPRFDGTLADVPAELEDALIYAAAAQASINRVEITDVKTATHQVKRQVASNESTIDKFERLYEEALDDVR